MIRKTVAIVPCKNGAQAIAQTVQALLSESSINEVLVVDDGSTDNTAEVARGAGASVLCLPYNSGKGAALTAGVNATPDATHYVLVDADTRNTANETIHLLAPVIAGEALLAIGVLPSAGNKAGLGTIRRLSSKAIKRACGANTRAPLSGQRAIDGELMRSLEMAPKFGCEVGMTIDAVRAGATVIERDVEMDHHHTGRTFSGFVHRGRQGIDIVRALFPRMIPAAFRHGVLVIVTMFILGFLLTTSSRSTASDASALPHAETAIVVLVPGWSWNDISRDDTRITKYKGLEEILDPAMPAITGSVATGKVKDIATAVAQGSRTDTGKGTNDVRVAVIPKGITRSQTFPKVRIVMGVTLADQKPELRPIVIQGLNQNGELVSDSTKHNGVVDLTDIAPTVRWIQSMANDPSLAAPLEVRTNANAVSNAATTSQTVKVYDRHQPLFVLVFVLIQVALFVFAFLTRNKGWRPSWQLYVATLIAATPLSAQIAQLACAQWFSSHDVPSWGTWSACFALAMGIILGMARIAAISPLLWLRRIIFASIAVTLVDVLTGGSLQFGGLFGSSPALGARYYGIGNVSSALLLYGTLLWAALTIHLAAKRGPQSRNAAWWRTFAFATLTTGIVGTPGLGADVGGLFTDVVVFAAFFANARWGTLKLRSIALIALGGIAALVLAAIADAQRAPANRTHLGRLAARVGSEGVSPLWSTVSEKVHTNLLGYGFPWTLLVIGLAVGILVQLLRGEWPQSLPTNSIERTGAIAALSGSGVAYGVNDSGIVTLVLVAVFLGPFLMVCHRTNRWDTAHVLWSDAPNGASSNLEAPIP